MKNTILTFLFLLACFSLSAQQDYKAKLTDSGIIKLSQVEDLSAPVYADFSPFSQMFDSNEDKQRFLKSYSKELVLCAYNAEKNCIEILLQTDEKTQNWSLADWNSYLRNPELN